MEKYLKDEVRAALEKFKIIKSDIPNLHMYLVWSSNLGQCNLVDNPIVIFSEFPQFFVFDEYFIECDGLLNAIKNQKKRLEKENTEKSKDELKILKKRFEEKLKYLKPTTNIFIEFRFESLNFDLIRQLKSHPMVQQPPHMMSDAYVRIILRRSF